MSEYLGRFLCARDDECATKMLYKIFPERGPLNPVAKEPHCCFLFEPDQYDDHNKAPKLARNHLGRLLLNTNVVYVLNPILLRFFPIVFNIHRQAI